MVSQSNPNNALSPWDEEAIKQGKAIKAQEDAFYAGGGATGSYNGPTWVSSSDQLNEAVKGLPPVEPRYDINGNISKDWDASGKFTGTYDKPLSKVYKPEDYNQDHLRAVMAEYGFKSLDAAAGFSERVLGNTPGKELSIGMPSRFNPNKASLSALDKAGMPLGQRRGIGSTFISDVNDPLYGGYGSYTTTDPIGGGRAQDLNLALGRPKEGYVDEYGNTIQPPTGFSGLLDQGDTDLLSIEIGNTTIKDLIDEIETKEEFDMLYTYLIEQKFGVNDIYGN